MNEKNENSSARARGTTVPREHRTCYVSTCRAAATGRVRWRFSTGYESEHHDCRAHLDVITERIAVHLPAGVDGVEVTA